MGTSLALMPLGALAKDLRKSPRTDRWSSSTVRPQGCCAAGNATSLPFSRTAAGLGTPCVAARAEEPLAPGVAAWAALNVRAALAYGVSRASSPALRLRAGGERPMTRRARMAETAGRVFGVGKGEPANTTLGGLRRKRLE